MLNEKLSEGGTSFEQGRSELSGLAKGNVTGSDDWDNAVDTAIAQHDNTISNNDKRINMLDMTSREDFDEKRNLQQSNISAATQKLAEIQAAGELEYGKDYNPENDPRYMAAKEDLYNKIEGFTETFTEEK